MATTGCKRKLKDTLVSSKFGGRAGQPRGVEQYNFDKYVKLKPEISKMIEFSSKVLSQVLKILRNE